MEYCFANSWFELPRRLRSLRRWSFALSIFPAWNIYVVSKRSAHSQVVLEYVSHRTAASIKGRCWWSGNRAPLSGFRASFEMRLFQVPFSPTNTGWKWFHLVPLAHVSDTPLGTELNFLVLTCSMLSDYVFPHKYIWSWSFFWRVVCSGLEHLSARFF